MVETTNTITLHSSTDGIMFSPIINGIDICRTCGKRTLVCPHKFSKYQAIELPPYCTHVKAVDVEPDLRLTMSSERNARLVKIVDNVKFTVLESITALEDLWEVIGLSESGKNTRHETMLDHIQDLLKEMLAEEDELKQKMVLSAKEYELEAIQLYKDLGMSPKETPTQMSLMQLERVWRTEVDVLNKEKHDRLKQLKRLRTDEEKFCGRLVMPQHDLNFIGCPSIEQLRELEQNVKFLKGEQIKRLELFLKLQTSIKQLWVELDVEPVNKVEKEMVALDAEESFILSKQNLDELSILQKKLEQEHSDLIQQIDLLREKIKFLWDRLETPAEDRINFLHQTSSNSPKVAKLLMKQVDRLEEQKRQHMQTFIESIRKELVLFWDKCFFGEEQRQLFVSFYSDVFTEEILNEHEHQVASVKNYYKENAEIFNLVEKRQGLWKKKLEFENRTTDSNRLNNRGGALLKEEKLRKAVVKELPKVESEVRKKIKAWEKENETYFLYYGERYIDHIDQEKDDYEEEQKLKKEEKLRVKKEELCQEAVYGSKTCSKRKHVTTFVSTPSKPAKRERMEATQFTHSRFTHSSIASPRQKHIDAENKTPVRRQPAIVKKTLISKLKIKSEARRKSLRRKSGRLMNAKRGLSNRSAAQNNLLLSEESRLDDSKVVSGSSLPNPNPDMSALISYNDFTSAVAESPCSRSSFVSHERTPNMLNYTSLRSSNNTNNNRLRSANKTIATEKSTK